VKHLIYFCNIDIKHLKHTSQTSETLETYAFSAMSPCYLDEWRLAAMYGARGSTELAGAIAAWEAGGAASHEAPLLACLLEHPSWRLVGSVEQPRRADGAVQGGKGSGTSRRRWVDAGTRRQASLVEAGQRRRPRVQVWTRVTDCEAVKEEQCTVETGPRVTFATDMLLGPVCRPNKQASWQMNVPVPSLLYTLYVELLTNLRKTSRMYRDNADSESAKYIGGAIVGDHIINGTSL
jgi:hypothetical protein